MPAEKLKYDQGRLPATVRIDVENAKGATDWNSTYYNYLVDTIIAKPEITLNNLAGDNEIDYVESGANYQNIKGTVSYSEPNNESTSGEIVFLIDGKEYTNRLDGDSFNVALPTDVLLNAQNKTITAFARTKDSAGNTATSDRKTISYTQDLEELTILVIPDETPIKIKNGTARISGTYETTGTVVKTTITLTDKDGQAIPAEVDTASKTWYADVPVDRLPEPEGVVVVTINALIENKGGENGGTVIPDQSSGFYTLIPESDSNATPSGGLGSDTLIGGAGADIYVFNTEFNGTIDTLIMDNNDKIHLSADIFNGLTKGSTANLDKHIKYDSETNTLSYDADGSGEIDDIIFAQVAGEFNFTLDKFTVI